MTLRYVPPEGEERGIDRGSEGAAAGGPVGPPAVDRRRRVMSDPNWVTWVAVVVVAGTVFPLAAMPLSSMPARVGLAAAAVIAVLIALSVRRETDRIRMREELRAAPKCRACGRRYDEPLGEAVGLRGARCPECGRAAG